MLLICRTFLFNFFLDKIGFTFISYFIINLFLFKKQSYLYYFLSKDIFYDLSTTTSRQKLKFYFNFCLRQAIQQLSSYTVCVCSVLINTRTTHTKPENVHTHTQCISLLFRFFFVLYIFGKILLLRVFVKH